MLDQLDALTKAHPAVRLTIHVDDVAHPVSGVGDAAVARRCLDVGSALCKAFEEGLGLPFARHKTAALATSKALAVRVAAKLRDGERGSAELAARSLGYAYALNPHLAGRTRPGG